MEASMRVGQALGVYVVIAKEERRADALAEVQRLREQGYRVDYALSSAKVPKQFQAAEQLGARVALLFGDEWPQVAIKNLGTGEQELVASGDLAKRVNALLR
jgi:histidyl-tRNA synthetase